MDWTKIGQLAMQAVQVLAPVAETAATALGQPEIAAGIGFAEKLVQAANEGSTTAINLVTQIKNGTPPSKTQMLEFEQEYEDSYQKLKKDLADKLSDVG